MKRVLRVIVLLAVVLSVALVLRVRKLREADKGPPGGTGVIEGVDVNVTSRMASRILSVTADEGDMVKAGDVLVTLDCATAEAVLGEAKARLSAAEVGVEVSSAHATHANKNAAAARGSVAVVDSQLATLVAQERLAKSDLKRLETLLAQGATTNAAVDAARTKRDTIVSQIATQKASAKATRTQAGALKSAGSTAKAQILAAKTNIEVARAAVSLAEANVRECRIPAPRGGLISSRNFEPGEAVQPGSTVLSITDLSEARVRFYIQNRDMGSAAPGRRVTVTADAYPGETFKGTIRHVASRAEFTPRNVQTRDDRERLVYAVEVRIPNKEMRLRSGMPVEVAIEDAK